MLPSGKSVIVLEPKFDAILKYPGKGMVLSGVAPSGSEYEYITRFFCPQYGVKEVNMLHIVPTNCFLALNFEQ